MNAFQKQIQRQFEKLPAGPRGLEIDYDSLTKTLTVQMKGFLVYVDYHKRKGLKLSSAVYEFEGGIPDGEILGFLKSAEGKSKKKGSGNKIEWGGESEVLYMQDYPKDIIDEDKLQQLGQAVFDFHRELLSVRKIMVLIKQDAGRSVQKNEENVEADAFFEHAMMLKQPSGKGMSHGNSSGDDRFSDDASVTGGVANSVPTRVGTNSRWFGRKNKKKTSELMELGAAESDSDSAGLLVH